MVAKGTVIYFPLLIRAGNLALNDPDNLQNEYIGPTQVFKASFFERKGERVRAVYHLHCFGVILSVGKAT